MELRGIVFAAALAVASVGASATPVLVNGGFESGSLAGWTASGANAGSCDTNFNVSASGSAANCDGYSPIPPTFVAPVSGSYAAYASFDGNGPEHHTLTQAFNIAAGATVLNIDWQDALGFGSGWIFPQPRVFTVNLLKANGSLEATLFSESFTNTASGILQNWTSHDIDASIYLADLGPHAKLQFDLYVPQSFTGPGAFGLDNVAVVTSVPEPASLALAGLALTALAFTLRAKRR
jgi:hypothetical protein